MYEMEGLFTVKTVSVHSFTGSYLTKKGARLAPFAVQHGEGAKVFL